jgi:hypothetical protein
MVAGGGLASMITVGLNAGFGAPLAAEFAGLATYGFAVARQDVWTSEDLPIATALVTEFAGAPVRPLYLIGGGHMQHANGTVLMPSELAMWTIETIEAAHTAGITNYALEIGNEPDIAHQVYADDPHVFAVAVRLCYDMARAHGFTGSVITGGIANLDERGMEYLATCVPTFPRGVVVGFHRYPPAGGNAETPHAPYRSREDEWQHLMGVVDGRRVACTEFGYHTSEEHRHQRHRRAEVGLGRDEHGHEADGRAG